MASTEMAVPVNERVVVGARRPRYIHWRSAVGGAVAAAALGLVLQGFAAAIGLSLASTSPTWRDTSTMLILLAGLYLIFSAIIAFGLGGYIAGRASSAFSVPTVDREEIEFRDGSNGLLAWALAMLLTTFIAFGAAQSAAARLGTASAPQSSAAESLIAFDIDKLFRSDKPLAGDMAYARAEAGRILLTANGHSGLEADDHDYLVRLVERHAGLASADATRRVDDVVARTRDDVARARRAAVILAFMAAAAALIGAVIAWGAAGIRRPPSRRALAFASVELASRQRQGVASRVSSDARDCRLDVGLDSSAFQIVAITKNRL